MKAINKISHIIVLTYRRNEVKKFKRDLSFYTKDDDIRVLHSKFDDTGGVIKFCYKK
ncbi:hypothetical protein [Macrococcoides caseolyticum]|uniref:hypothetical protein n=1 Tax=Macrococcoides caseolyticum TaxID=69966 RepID=UPI0015EB9271|nr:hypothetical protein [Macrococcus caseolyticus]